MKRITSAISITLILAIACCAIFLFFSVPFDRSVVEHGNPTPNAKMQEPLNADHSATAESDDEEKSHGPHGDPGSTALDLKGNDLAEMVTPENGELIRTIVEAVRAAHESGSPVLPKHQLIYDIDQLLMEVNSGASFEQYFVWASVEEIRRVVPALRTLGLSDVADVTERATQVAFPKGIPATDDEKSELTDWSETQVEKLQELFPALEKENGRITNVLAAYAKKD